MGELEAAAAEYSVPVLGLIFLRYADHKFTQAEEELARKGGGQGGGRSGRWTTRPKGCSTCPRRPGSRRS